MDAKIQQANERLCWQCGSRRSVMGEWRRPPERFEQAILRIALIPSACSQLCATEPAAHTITRV